MGVSFEFDLPDIPPGAELYLPLAIMLAAGLAAFWPRTAAQRSRRAERWARYNLATLTPQLFNAADRAFARRSRSIGIWALISAAAIAVLVVARPASSLVEVWIVIVAFGIGTSITLAFQFTWPWLETGPTRTARARAVGLGDYVPTPLRVGAWAGGAACLIAVALLPLIMEPSPHLVAQVLLLGGIVVSLVVAECTGRRVTRRPQPAGNDAELYAQDAWRADIAQLGFRSIALWAGIALSQVSAGESLRPEISHSILFVSLALEATFILTLLLSFTPTDRFRARLWPQLHAGEFVGHHTGVSA